MSMSPAQVTNRLVLSARAIIADHWPRAATPDLCPICHWPWPCDPTKVAYTFLRLVGQGGWVPRHARTGAREPHAEGPGVHSPGPSALLAGTQPPDTSPAATGSWS
ncbi:hypothetical protein [Micromonospora tulbaghiae]|uniref:hypothetical protein n=1 Tax=Micromonospora tulbaghiae TaxID=479978 RepID=UPI003D9EDD47